LIDFLAFEPQFLDHLVPVWHATPEYVRGSFRVAEELLPRALAKGIPAQPENAHRLRVSSLPPRAMAPEEGPKAMVASIGDTKIGRRLGYRNFAFMEHGAGQAYRGRGALEDHPSYAGGIDREDTTLFLCPNDYSADLWRKAYPNALTSVIGCPKLDTLPAREPGPAPVVAISFHWPAFTAPEANTALGHYLSALTGLGKSYRTIGHAHPKGDWPDRMERLYKRSGIEFVPDFEDVCRRADVYVCDNSSTLFEFAATGRPVVVLNCPEYRKSAEHGLRFWEAADVGIQVEQPADLVEAIRTALEDHPIRQVAREKALDIVYAYRSGAAARAAAALEFWAIAAHAEAV
jgi:hypothetical protein